MPNVPNELGVETGRARATEICSQFPEVEVVSYTGQHTGFKVRGKAFAYYQVDHHGDGRITFAVRMTMEAQQAFVSTEPDRASISPYVGRYGWVDIDLEARPVDWDEIAAFARGSYRIVAPKSLAKLVEEP